MKIDDKKRKIVCEFLRIGLSLCLLVWLFKTKVDIPRTISVLKNANFCYILYAGIIFLSINGLILVRWLILIKALGLKVPVKNVVIYFFSGLYFNLFLPSSTGGDVLKIYYMCKDTSHKAKVVASVVLDRLSGFIAMIIVAFLSFIFGYRWINDPSLLVLILAMAVFSGIIILFLFNEKLYSFGSRLFNPFPKIKKNLMDLHYDIVLLKGNRRAIFSTIGLSCLCQIIFAFVFYLIAKSFHQNVGMLHCLIFVPIICVAASLPSIGGLGVREAGAAYLFAKVGVEDGISISISLVSYIFMVIVGLIGGIVYITTLSHKRVMHLPEEVQTLPEKV